MGKLKGIVQFTGSIDGLSFYELDGKVIVRKTGGFKGDAIKTKANYGRTRENASEFGRCSVLGKQFRKALHPYLKKLNDRYLYQFVTGLMTHLMKCDTLSERGQRKVSVGIGTPEGKKLLEGFEFNRSIPFDHFLAGNYAVRLLEGGVILEDFTIGQVAFPRAASHLSLRLLLLRFDFEMGAFSLAEGEPVVLSRTSGAGQIRLTAIVPEGDGVLLGLVFAEFSQEINGLAYPLEGCALRVVGCYKLTKADRLALNGVASLLIILIFVYSFMNFIRETIGIFFKNNIV